MALMITAFLAIMLVIGGYSQPRELDPENQSENLLAAITLFNGDFINIRNLSGGNMTFIPIDIPAFQGYPAFYLEEVINNVVYLPSVSVIKELDNGTIKLQIYHFTDPTENTPNTFDISTLMDLDLEDFTPVPEFCNPTFNLVDDGIMSGDFPFCSFPLENGPIPHFTMNITCHGFSIFDIDQEGTIHFIFDHCLLCGSRFPYPPYIQERLANFESPCND